MSRKHVLQLVAVAALLVAVELTVAAIYAVAFVYPEYEGWLKLFGFAIAILTPLLVFILGLARIVQQRYAYGAVLMVLSPIPFLMPHLTIISGPYWKFLLNKPAYLSAIQSDQSASPKFKFFDWGNRNIGLGGGVFYEAIVYDETGDIARAPDARSPDWQTQRSLALPWEQWITAHPSDCPRTIESFGGHFYFVVMVCT